MIFQKVFFTGFLCIYFIFCSNILIGQTPQKVEVNEQIEKTENKIVLQKKKKTFSKVEKEKQIQQRKERKSAQKKNKCYGSTARIERAKVDLAKKKSQGKISQKEIIQEEKKIKRSTVQLEQKMKKVSKFSEKVGQ